MTLQEISKLRKGDKVETDYLAGKVEMVWAGNDDAYIEVAISGIDRYGCETDGIAIFSNSYYDHPLEDLRKAKIDY